MNLGAGTTSRPTCSPPKPPLPPAGLPPKTRVTMMTGTVTTLLICTKHQVPFSALRSQLFIIPISQMRI